MMNITPNIEDYLEAILKICQQNGSARVKDIADMLEVKNPSVTQQIQKLVGMNLVSHKSYGNVTLTKKGREIAKRTLERHQMFKELLSEIMHLPEDLAEEDACRMEHAITTETMERFRKMILFFREHNLDEKIKEYFEKESN